MSASVPARIAAACLAAVAVLTSCGLREPSSAEALDAREALQAFAPASVRDVITGATRIERPATPPRRPSPEVRGQPDRGVSRIRPRPTSWSGATADERTMLRLINATRSRWGGKGLVLDASLTLAARKHSRKMARDEALSHTSNLPRVIARHNWREAGENVGFGYSSESIHRASMKSDHHAGNIVHRAYTTAGIGIVWRRGVMYATVIFIG